MITVQRLISMLKKMPPRALVVLQSHDHGEYEVDGWAGYAYEPQRDEFLEARRREGEDINEYKRGQRFVAIRP